MSKVKKAETVETKVANNFVDELNSYKTMSAKIRFLNSKNMTPGAISKLLSQHEGKLIRYQWVRNVLNTPVTTPKEVIVMKLNIKELDKLIKAYLVEVEQVLDNKDDEYYLYQLESLSTLKDNDKILKNFMNHVIAYYEDNE